MNESVLRSYHKAMQTQKIVSKTNKWIDLSYYYYYCYYLEEGVKDMDEMTSVRASSVSVKSSSTNRFAPVRP